MTNTQKFTTRPGDFLIKNHSTALRVIHRFSSAGRQFLRFKEHLSDSVEETPWLPPWSTERRVIQSAIYRKN